MSKGKYKKDRSDVELPKGASPTEWERLSFNNVDLDRHRHFDCPHHRKCLDYASDLHWERFSCKWCAHFEVKRQELKILEKRRQKKKKKDENFI